VAKQKKMGEETEANKATSLDVSPPAELHALEAEAKRTEREQKKAEQEFEDRRKKAADARLKFETEMRENLAKTSRKDEKRTITVIVQQRKNKPVRLRTGLTIPCLAPTLVNRRELRILQGKSRAGYIELLVGDLKAAKPEDKG